MPLRLGTRASALARWQAEWVAAQLQRHGTQVELVPITTTGDRQQGEIRAIGGRPAEGVFTKEIQQALLDGRIDLAVHSLKDLPTSGPSGLCLAAVPERGPVADVLVSSRHTPRAAAEGNNAEGNNGVGSRCSAPSESGGADILVCPEKGEQRGRQECLPHPNLVAHLERLPPHAVVGTSSLRRRAQLLHIRPDLEMRDLRGNVETRLRKLQKGDFDALILAEAGLRRLGIMGIEAEPASDKDSRPLFFVLPLELMLPAVGQGALGLETRTEDHATRELLSVLDHPPTHAAVLAERAMLAALQGGCLAPIAALARIEGDQLALIGRVIGYDGIELLEARNSATLPSPDQPSVGARQGAGGEGRERAEQLGRQVAEVLLAQGAGRLIGAARAVR